jgi:Mrp family chromosome partitioning ATPase
VLALGASFAAAGRRTLLVDTDVERFGLTRHLALQSERGLCEAIGPEQKSGEIHETERERLFVLPIGQASQIEAEDLSRDKLESLLKTLRREFEVIVIDAGPVLSSVESSLVAAAADRVLVVVGRNQHKRLVQSTLEYLQQLGVRETGIVLNRALPVDLNRQRKRFDPTRHRAISFVNEQQIRRRKPATVGRIGDDVAAEPMRKRRAA